MSPSPRALRVLHVNDVPVDGPDTGGAETYIRRLAGAQRDQGDDVRLFATADPGARVGRVLDLWNPRTRRELAATVAAYRPDVVHLHNVLRALSPSVFTAMPAVPVVMTVHDLRLLGESVDRHGYAARALAARWLQRPVAIRLARRYVDAWVAPGPYLGERLRAAGLEPVTEVPVPVPGPLRDPEPVQRCDDVVYAGRLASGKNPVGLLAAFARLPPPADPDRRRLVLVGDGPQRAALVALAGRLGIAERVVITGWLDDAGVSAALGRARVVVVPSVVAEGAPTVAVEAARHGRPVVTGNRGGLPALAQALGADCVDAADPAALAAALAPLLDEPDEAARRGAVAKERAHSHDPATVAAAIDAVYRRALDARMAG